MLEPSRCGCVSAFAATAPVVRAAPCFAPDDVGTGEIVVIADGWEISLLGRPTGSTAVLAESSELSSSSLSEMNISLGVGDEYPS